MYNKKVLSNAVKNLDSTKAPAKKKDIIVDPMGQWKYPGQNTRIPSNDITMQDVPYPVWAVPNVGIPQMMYPEQDYYFPGAEYVDEYPLLAYGGDISVPELMQAQKGITIYDPIEYKYRNKMYTDSLNLYKAYQMQDKLMGPGNTRIKNDKSKWTTQELKEGRKKTIVPGFMAISKDYQSEQDQFKDGYDGWTARPIDQQLIRYYKSLGFTDKDIMYHSSPDVVSDKIRAIGTYDDGFARSPIYKKPVQPVIYQKEPPVSLSFTPPPIPDLEFEPPIEPEIQWTNPNPWNDVEPAKTYPKAYLPNYRTGVWSATGKHTDLPEGSWEDSRKNYKEKNRAQTLDLMGKTFEEGGDYIDTEATQEEIDAYRKGGYVVKELAALPKKKGSKAYSRSLTATNQLFAQNPLTKKAKSRKNKIFDPTSKYFEKGGFQDDLDKHQKLLRDWTYGADIGMLHKAQTGQNSRRSYDPLLDYKPQVAESTVPKNLPKVDKAILDKAVKQKTQERKAVASAIKKNPTLTEKQKTEILMSPQKLDENVHLAYQGQPDIIKQVEAPSTSERVWDIVTNPQAAFEYAVRTGDVSNMPYNYNKMLMAGIDPSAGGGANLVGDALNMSTNLLDAGDKVVRNIGEGNYGTAGLQALRFLPGARVSTGLRKTPKQLPGSGNALNLEELRRVYHNSERFLQLEEARFLHKYGHGKESQYRNANQNQLPLPPSEIQFMPDGTTRTIYNQQPITDYVSGSYRPDYTPTQTGFIDLTRGRQYDRDLLVQDYNNMVNGLPATNYPNLPIQTNVIQQQYLNTRRAWETLQNTAQTAPKPKTPVNKSGLTKEEVLQKASGKDKDKISKMSETEFENTVLKPNGEIAPYYQGSLESQFSGSQNVIALSPKQYADAFNERLDLLNDIITQRNKSGVEYRVKGLDESGRLTFYTPKQTIANANRPVPQHYLDALNKIEEPGFLYKGYEDKFYFSNMTGSPGFKTKQEAKNWITDIIEKEKGINIPEGESTWGVRLNPGQWRGNVEDIANTEYLRSIPGLEMTDTRLGVFADNVPRKGTGAYESINEYLKKLDLGRVKPGFNQQTEFSKGAWENFIKSGRGVGFYANPRTVYGTMKTIFPYAGAGYLGYEGLKEAGAMQGSQPQKQSYGGHINPYMYNKPDSDQEEGGYIETELTPQQIQEYRDGGYIVDELD